MGWCIVKQPNGKFATFSTVVDDFTAMNMTEAEAQEACIDQGASLPRVTAAMLNAEVDDVWFGEKLDEGDTRWLRALWTVEFHHGPIAAAERFDMGGRAPRGEGRPASRGEGG